MAICAGLNDAVKPLGSPDTPKVARPLNPLPDAVVIVYVVLCPAIRFTAEGAAEMVKVLDGSMVNTEGGERAGVRRSAGCLHGDFARRRRRRNHERQTRRR